MSCFTYTNNNPYGGSVYISGTTCEGFRGAFTLNFGDTICMNTSKAIITCENPSMIGTCQPFDCCLENNFTNPISASYVARTLLLDDGTILVMSNNPEYSGQFNRGVFRIDSCGNLLTTYPIPLLFSSGGGNGGFAKQSDGKIVVGMDRQTFRINADYLSLDTTFVSGTTDVNLGITGIICNDQDEILIVGSFGTNWTYSAGTITYNSNVYKFNKDGIPDPTFSGKTITSLGGSADDSDLKRDYNTNKIMLDGVSSTYGSSLYQGAVRLNNDFSIDTTFRAAGFTGVDGGLVLAIEPLSNGQYLVGGAFQNYSGFSNQDFLIRLNNDGSLDTTFDWAAPETNIYVTDIAVQSTGKIIPTTVGNFVRRFNSNGSFDNTWITGTTGGNIAQTNILLFPTDQLFVGGYFSTYNSQSYPKMVKLDKDGGLDMCPLPTPSPTTTATLTPSPTATIGMTPTATPSQTMTQTNTPSVTQTNTATPTLTPSPTTLCEDILNFSLVSGPPINALQGDYTRQFSNSATTFTFGYFSGGTPARFFTGATFDTAQNYPVYMRQSGSTYSVLGRTFITSSNWRWQIYTTTGSSYLDNQVTTPIGSLQITTNEIPYDGMYIIPEGLNTYIGRTYNIDYPVSCITPTPSVTPSITPTITPSVTQTITATPTTTQTNTATPTSTATPTTTQTNTPSITPSQSGNCICYCVTYDPDTLPNDLYVRYSFCGTSSVETELINNLPAVDNLDGTFTACICVQQGGSYAIPVCVQGGVEVTCDPYIWVSGGSCSNGMDCF